MEVTNRDRKRAVRTAPLANEVLETARALLERHKGSLRGAQLDARSSAVLSEQEGDWTQARRWRATAAVLAVLDSALP